MNLDLREIPAVYINLLQDTGRNRDMKKLCKKCGFKTVLRIDAEYTPNSLAGCSLSHHNALNEVDPPFIVFEDDIKEWHINAKACLDGINKDYYPCFSDNCNNYFKIPHRNERRGVGGIFFDNVTDLSLENSIKMLESVANAYLRSYMEIANKRKNIKFSDTERDFQLIRRGRYVEFNLIYDRGTLFGLQSNGRIESILASLPNNTKWQYKKTKEYIRLEKELLSTINKDWNV